MPNAERYRRQVRLLMRLLPLVAEEPCFALKGGTAINLFVRDLPRLSVDIDLVYLPLDQRPQALAGIDAAMRRIENRIRRVMPESRIGHTLQEEAILRLIVQDAADRTQVKIEVSPVLRGVVFEPKTQPVSEAVEEMFGFAEFRLVSFADLYAGKLVAALDRQHPRDFFDVRELLAHEGLNEDIREAFVIYLISNGRPMHEVLSCRRKDMSESFDHSFNGMTDRLVSLADLEATREAMVGLLVKSMPDRHRTFLLGFEAGSPDWSSLRIAHARDLPAVQWRIRNLETLAPEARERLTSSLLKIWVD